MFLLHSFAPDSSPFFSTALVLPGFGFSPLLPASRYRSGHSLPYNMLFHESNLKSMVVCFIIFDRHSPYLHRFCLHIVEYMDLLQHIFVINLLEWGFPPPWHLSRFRIPSHHLYKTLVSSSFKDRSFWSLMVLPRFYQYYLLFYSNRIPLLAKYRWNASST